MIIVYSYSTIIQLLDWIYKHLELHFQVIARSTIVLYIALVYWRFYAIEEL